MLLSELISIHSWSKLNSYLALSSGSLPGTLNILPIQQRLWTLPWRGFCGKIGQTLHCLTSSHFSSMHRPWWSGTDLKVHKNTYSSNDVSQILLVNEQKIPTELYFSGSKIQFSAYIFCISCHYFIKCTRFRSMRRQIKSVVLWNKKYGLAEFLSPPLPPGGRILPECHIFSVITSLFTHFILR